MSEYARFDLNAALCRSTSKSHTFVVNCIVVTTIINTRSFSRFFLFLSNSLILSLCVASAICMPWLLLLLFCYFRSAIDKFLQEKEFNFLEKRYSSGSDLSELSTLFCLVMRMKIFINSKLNTIIFFLFFLFDAFSLSFSSCSHFISSRCSFFTSMRTCVCVCLVYFIQETILLYFVATSSSPWPPISFGCIFTLLNTRNATPNPKSNVKQSGEKKTGELNKQNNNFTINY